MTWARYPKRDNTTVRRAGLWVWLQGIGLPCVLGCIALVGAASANRMGRSVGLLEEAGLSVVLGLSVALGLSAAAVLWVGARLVRLGLRRLDYASGDHLRVSTALAEEWSEGTAPRRLRALALVGLGDFAAARRDLLSPSEANQEDRELRLCAHIVMLAFEGQGLAALRLCHSLLAVPVSVADGQEQRRQARREGIVAIVRALCGTADEEDYRALTVAARFEPALHWACCYGAAVACCVKSETSLARKLVEDAPRWPKESAFCQLHSRILASALP